MLICSIYKNVFILSTIIILVIAGTSLCKADGFLSFRSYDSFTMEPLKTSIVVFHADHPDTISDSTSAGGYFFAGLPADSNFKLIVSHDPDYYRYSSEFEITDNETTFIESYLQPNAEVIFTIFINNPENADYRLFYANGTWDGVGRYRAEIDNDGFVSLNDSGNSPDSTAGDGYFTGSLRFALDSENTYSWGAYCERYNPSSAILHQGEDFNLLNMTPYYSDTLIINPSGNDPNWGISLYNPTYGEFDLSRDGNDWSRTLPFNEGEYYPLIFRAMHSDFPYYGQGGVGGDTIMYYSVSSGNFEVHFLDNSDTYGIRLDSPTAYFNSFPDSLRFEAEHDSSYSDTIRIYNYGGLALTYNIDILVDSLPNGISGIYSDPDGYGYIWTDSDRSGDINYYWLDIENDGIRVDGLEDDNFAGPFYIGFPFWYYGEYFDSFYISSNGYVTLGTPSSEPGNIRLPSIYGPSNIIAPYWDDYDMTLGGSVYYKSSHDSLIVSFIDLVRKDGVYPYIFQMILSSDHTIGFQFDALPLPRNKATTGLQDSDGSYGTTMGFNSNFIHSIFSLRIFPSWISMASYSGFLQAGGFTYIPLTVRGHNFQAGIYDAKIKIRSTDPDTIRGNVSIPVRMEYSGTGIGNDYDYSGNLPGTTELYPNYPNPFNPSTNISFYLPLGEIISLNIYNIRGRKIACLIDSKYMANGMHSITWDGKSKDGKNAASGIYFYTLKSDNVQHVRKMLLIK
ncbi:MAG: T9SS type A sorting domain-containing protein [candidate division Zixibacteria bacterium]|nr:T9SS type A sorting domain-containing protein [candidate division Zixibacteria bacterium]